MPIIYLKRPRSGSHFRFIGGTKGGRPMRGAQKHRMQRMQKMIRSVGWASCNTAFQNAVRWGPKERRARGPLPSFGSLIMPTYAQFLYTFAPAAYESLGFLQSRNYATPIQQGRPQGPAFSSFQKPCR